ncbi:hypothetical protein [Cohaesibacter gelatinilyticus]|uniref:Uncharacterized protein n=1 Tax=Cohaesibacter gelatinilyticus TaxID=372072 RepID=A0A285PFU2_9HYPH|nr:hypothetical protein [Cohaesibacter gelatinilyticus]SNZ20569.1 hypothetical protein SAMN06265368_3674 [Cohaesibacter gelatinilyticus]
MHIKIPAEKIAYHFVAIIALMLASMSYASAQVQATPMQYDVEVQSILLCTDANCGTSTTLSNTTATFALASGGGPLATQQPYTINRIVQATGNYTHMRLTVTNSIKVTGSVTNVANPAGGTMTCNTVAGGVIDLGAGDNGQSHATPGALGIMNYVVSRVPPAFVVPANLTINVQPATLTLTYQLPFSLNATAGDVIPEVDIKFKVTDSLNALGVGASTCGLYISPPTLRITPKA